MSVKCFKCGTYGVLAKGLCRKCYSKKWRKQKADATMKRLAAKFGRTCRFCGDHIDDTLLFAYVEEGTVKSFSYILLYNWDRVLQEVEKTAILCEGCYIKFNWGMISIEELKPHVTVI
jgi:hypothetical protein